MMDKRKLDAIASSLQNGDVLQVGTETQFGIVRGVRPIEKAQEDETYMKAGVWYIVELPNRSSINNLRYFHEKELMREINQRRDRKVG